MGRTWRVVTIVLPNLRGVQAALDMLEDGRRARDGVGGREADGSKVERVCIPPPTSSVPSSRINRVKRDFQSTHTPLDQPVALERRDTIRRLRY
jgi:hypothetical protein